MITNMSNVAVCFAVKAFLRRTFLQFLAAKLVSLVLGNDAIVTSTLHIAFTVYATINYVPVISSMLH